MSVDAFDFAPRTRIVFGPGSVARVGEIAAELGARRVLLVTDRGLVEAGHADHVRDALAAAGLTHVTFDAVHENPTTADVDACVEAAKAGDVDFIVGLGGGSSMDAAKGCNFLLTNGGRMADYRGVGRASKPMLPLITVPTTTGTGSELQSFALIADAETHRKMACGDPKAAARVAILDPELAVSQPRAVRACTGLDCLAHAVETAVTARRNPISRMLSREAFRLAQAAFPRVLETPEDLEAQGEMLLAAGLAGLAIENSMLGAAHSMANPLTAGFDVIHGQAVGLVLPHVVGFNAAEPAAAAEYAQLAAAAGLTASNGSPTQSVQALVERLDALRAASGLDMRLGALGIPESAVDDLAEDAATQWTAQFNPRPVGVEEFRELYRASL